MSYSGYLLKLLTQIQMCTAIKITRQYKIHKTTGMTRQINIKIVQNNTNVELALKENFNQDEYS